MTTHNAPSVVYPLGRSFFQGCLLAGFWCAGLLVTAAWFYAAGRLDWRIFLVAFMALAAGFAAFHGWQHSPAGNLAWDGQLWRWESASYQTGVAEQKILILADFQNVLLLRIENQAGASLWLWAERKAAPDRWMDLRRAVYSPARAVAISGPMQFTDFPDAKP